MEPAAKFPRKWNSKKLRAIVQHCLVFLSKYDSPVLEEKIAGLQRTRVQFLVKNDVPMKVILRTHCLGGGRSTNAQMLRLLKWRERELNGWLLSAVFFFFFYPHRLQLLGPCGQGAFEAPQSLTQHVASGCSKSLGLLGAGWYEGNPPAPSLSFQGWGH